jgi:hypothetical protein
LNIEDIKADMVRRLLSQWRNRCVIEAEGKKSLSRGGTILVLHIWGGFRDGDGSPQRRWDGCGTRCTTRAGEFSSSWSVEGFQQQANLIRLVLRISSEFLYLPQILFFISSHDIFTHAYNIC